MHLTQNDQTRINAFQIRGLRKILKLCSSYYDRRNSNAHVMWVANRKVQREGSEKEIIKTTDYIELARIKLLGDIFRAEKDDPIRQVTLVPFINTPYSIPLRRAGCPRKHWTVESARLTWTKLGLQPNFEDHDRTHWHRLNEAAKQLHF